MDLEKVKNRCIIFFYVLRSCFGYACYNQPSEFISYSYHENNERAFSSSYFIYHHCIMFGLMITL